MPFIVRDSRRKDLFRLISNARNWVQQKSDSFLMAKSIFERCLKTSRRSAEQTARQKSLKKTYRFSHLQAFNARINGKNIFLSKPANQKLSQDDETNLLYLPNMFYHKELKNHS